MRKVYITLTVDVIIIINEGTMMDEVMENLVVTSDNDGIAEVEDSQILDYKITDSK
jgi:hypothetical protein